jgi:hypothetical protein
VALELDKPSRSPETGVWVEADNPHKLAGSIITSPGRSNSEPAETAERLQGRGPGGRSQRNAPKTQADARPWTLEVRNPKEIELSSASRSAKSCSVPSSFLNARDQDTARTVEGMSKDIWCLFSGSARSA